MEFHYEVLSYVPYENRMFVSYKPVDTTLTPHGGWVPIQVGMTEEQIKEAIIKAAPLYVWESPVNNAAKSLEGFHTTEAVSHTTPDAAPMSAAATARSLRDSILYQSDWAVMPDSPLPEAKITEWKAYRQVLRDLPTQSGFPDNVDWEAIINAAPL